MNADEAERFWGNMHALEGRVEARIDAALGRIDAAVERVEALERKVTRAAEIDADMAMHIAQHEQALSRRARGQGAITGGLVSIGTAIAIAASEYLSRTWGAQ